MFASRNRSSRVAPAPPPCRLEPLEGRVLMHAGHHEAGTGLVGEYFDNADFTGLAFTRTDPAIHFNWKKASPAPEIAPDDFSVRWSGRLLPHTTGRHTFRVAAKDGVRVWINNQPVVDRWPAAGKPATPAARALRRPVFQLDLTEGQMYDLKVEYYEGRGPAAASLMWRAPGAGRKFVPVAQAHLFPPPPPPEPEPEPKPEPKPEPEPEPVLNNIRWTEQAAAPIKRAEALRAVVDGKLYVFGGFSDALGPVVRSDVYDPAANTWTRIADLPTRLTHAGVTTDGTGVIFAGGYVGNGPGPGYSQTFGTTHVFRYEATTNTYTDLPPLPVARAGGGLVRVGRNLHYFGGNNLSRQDVADHYVLNLDGGTTWTVAAPMPAGRSHMGYAEVQGHILAIGGQTGNDQALTTHTSVFRYEPETNTWSPRAPMPKAISHVSSATFVTGGRVIVAGGEVAHASAVADVFAYDHTADAWTAMTSLPAPRFSGVAAEIGGFLYFTGGSSQTTTWKGELFA